MSRTVIEIIGKIYTNRILHSALWRTAYTENYTWEMTFSEKYCFEDWVFKVNVVWGAINIGRSFVYFSVMDYKVQVLRYF